MSMLGALIAAAFLGSPAAATGITFVNSAKGASAGAGTSFTITVPTVANNDFGLVLVGDRSGGSGDKPTVTDSQSATWVTQTEGASGGGLGWSVLATRFFDGSSSGATITCGSIGTTPSPSGAGTLLIFRGVNTTTPLNILQASLNLGAGTNSTSTVTPTYGSGSVLLLAVTVRTNTTFSAQTTANLGAFTEPTNGDSGSSAGSGQTAMMAYILNPAASATGTVSWTPGSGAASQVMIIELQKA